jgi:hypothetical protein
LFIFQGHSKADAIRKEAWEDESKAKDLKSRGHNSESRRLFKQSKDLHLRAAELIFNYYNADIADPYTLDLHNLTKPEAIVKLLDFINSKSTGILTVIVGKGNNSPNGKASLREHIMNHLDRGNVKSCSYHIPSYNTGVIKIILG